TPLASLAVPDGPIAGAAFAVVVALAVRYLPAALVRAGTIARRPLVLAIAALRRARSYAPGVVSPRVRTPTVGIVAGALAAIAVAGCVAVTAEPPPAPRAVAPAVAQGGRRRGVRGRAAGPRGSGGWDGARGGRARSESAARRARRDAAAVDAADRPRRAHACPHRPRRGAAGGTRAV